MAHSPDKKVRLRAAYIGGLPLEAAADKTGVPFATARNWYREARAAGDDWDAFQKASLVVAGGGVEQALGRIIAAALLRCEAMMEAAATDDPMDGVKAMAVLGDTVAKLKAASRGMMPEASQIAVASETLKAIAAWCGEAAPAKGLLLADLLDAYAASRKIQIAAPLEELRARARAAGAVESARASGLSDESAEQIRSKILGVQK